MIDEDRGFILMTVPVPLLNSLPFIFDECNAIQHIIILTQFISYLHIKITEIFTKCVLYHLEVNLSNFGVVEIDCIKLQLTNLFQMDAGAW